MKEPVSCAGYQQLEEIRLSRRNVLAGSLLGLLGWPAASSFAQVSFNSDSAEADRDVVIVIFMRGGMDGMHAVPPIGEDEYYKLRPNLALPKSGNDRVIRLNDLFGLHPSMKNLFPFFEMGELAVLHAVGSFDQTRSHFEAMNTMERGLAGGSAGDADGWISRYLRSTRSKDDSPLRAVALTSTLPDSLVGATHAMALPDLTSYRLAVPDDIKDKYVSQLEKLYAKSPLAIGESGQDTLRVMKKLEKLDPRAYSAANSAQYPDSPLGQAMKQAALLVKAEVGLEVACVDAGGWDSHVAQGGTTGYVATLLMDLADAMAAFATDLGPKMNRVTVVAMTEFGRRAYENAGFGTDHGRASAFFALGQGVNGGKVITQWPGLSPSQLEDGDLKVTTDYRDILSELITHRLRANPEPVFGARRAKPLGVFSAIG